MKLSDFDTGRKTFDYSKQDVEKYILSSEKNRKMLPLFEKLAEYKIVAECMESENCSLRINVGDKFVFSATGLYLPDESTANPCMQALEMFGRVTELVYERVFEGLDPNGLLICHNVQCRDIGVRHGGWGKTIFSVRCVRDPHNKFDLLGDKFVRKKRSS
jgi:hypothetical protein